MTLTARAVVTPLLFLCVLSGTALAQTGPADPEVIASASTAKISIGNRKLEGYAVATVRVGQDGRVQGVNIKENTADPDFAPQFARVLESARFRPAIDAAGRPVEADIDMKVELLQSTASQPKPLPANPDPDQADKEKARILKMRCSDFLWEWELLRKEARDESAEFMPRIATNMYAQMRVDAGDYVGAKVWKAAPKALKEAADLCERNPGAPFWEGIFRSVMDEAVPR